MNKNELAGEVATHCGLARGDVAKAVDSILEVIAEALRKGDEIKLIGFGTFSVGQRRATEGRNPRTGEKIQIPAARVARFKAGKALKEKLN